MQRFQGIINFVAISSEVTHFFCCGIPILFSLFSLIISLGLSASMPLGLESAHHIMHDYERSMIAVSAAILIVGWALHYVAYRIDCRSTGCSHEPCAPKKKRSGKILIIATILFVINVGSYWALHVL